MVTCVGAPGYLAEISISTVHADDHQADVFAPMNSSVARLKTMEVVAAMKNPTPNLVRELTNIWEKTDNINPEELHRVVIKSFTLLQPEVMGFVETCQYSTDASRVPEIPYPITSSENEFFRSNMLAFAGRYYTQRRMYEEALDAYAQLEISMVVDPATVLFNKAVCEQSLLKSEEGLQTLHNLLVRTQKIPIRYETIAKLMEHELKSLKEDSLDEVAKRMSDVERRLELGRTGYHTQKVEQEIISTMDEIIAELEKQTQSGSGGPGGNSNQPNAPASDSQVKGATAPGNVDKKDIGHQAGWGDLPPKDQAKAKQMIGNMFPSNYEKVIEKFSEKSASRKAP
jgi:hypothetical protein